MSDAGTHVSVGVLLTPGDLRRECQRTKQKPAFDAWAVYSRMPDDVVRLMESPVVPHGVTLVAMASRAGPVYLLLVHQAAAMQVRTVLSLQDDRTQDWLRHSAERGIVTLALEVEETAHLAVVQSGCGPVTPRQAEELIERHRPLPWDEFIDDAEALARRLAQPQVLPSVIDGIDVQSVRLVLTVGGPQDLTAAVSRPQPTPLH
jgi:hypothetical protein